MVAFVILFIYLSVCLSVLFVEMGGQYTIENPLTYDYRQPGGLQTLSSSILYATTVSFVARTMKKDYISDELFS